jgi:F0F1-type ATP synthase assembly protein I
MYVLFYRAETPALMEILRRNLSKTQREQALSKGTTAAYIEGIFLALVTGWVLENYPGSWRWLLSLFAVVGLVSNYLFYRLAIANCGINDTPKSRKTFSFVAPIREGFSLLRRSPQFLQFQWGYFLCGGGLMMALPVIPSFLKGHPFSFATLATSTTAIKEIGMILTTPLWGYLMRRFRYENLSTAVFTLVAMYLFLLLNIEAAYQMLIISFLIYGIAQAGSHMIWSLSGPYFSKEDDSSRYSMVNVFMVGVRGLVMPPTGALLSHFFGGEIAIFTGAIFCLLGAILISVPQKIENSIESI